MDAYNIHLLQLIAAITVVFVGFYVYTGEKKLLKVENYLTSKWNEFSDNHEEVNKILHEQITLMKEVNKLQSLLSTEQSKGKEQKETLMKEVNKLQALISAEQSEEIPAFNAVLSETLTPPLNQIIKFETVQTNIGGHYSPNTGIFTAPKAGLYTFAATVRSNSGKHLHCELQVNDQMFEKAFGTNLSTGTVNAVLQLKKGDRVCIKKDNIDTGEEAMLGGSWSMFSGYMIA